MRHSSIARSKSMHSINKFFATLLLVNGLNLLATPDARANNTPAPNVTSALVTLESIERKLSTIGSLRANQSVDIAPQVSGRVVELTIEDGHFVEQDTPLLSLDNREQSAKVEEARIALLDAKRQLAYMDELYKRRAVSKDELEAQQARVAMARATVGSLTAILDHYTLTAPFDGVLGFNEVSQGALINAGTVVTTLDDLETMKLYFELPENTLSDIPTGTQIEATTDAWPGQTFTGTIDSINPRIDPLNLTFRARAMLDNPEGKLRPGMLMRLNVIRPSDQVLVVPARSVMFNGNDRYVFVLDDNGLPQQRYIRTGIALENLMTVVEGLEQGETIVDQGVVKVVANRPVNILQTEVADTENNGQAGENRT